MKGGDVILTSLSQADGTIKIRPAILLCALPPFQDWLVCGISTQLHQQVSGFDEIITPGDTDFISSGLKSASVIRLGFLAVLPKKDIIGVIGTIAPARHQKLLKTLSDYLLQ